MMHELHHLSTHLAANPHHEPVFDSAGGPDVYSGVRIDYKGEQVNAVNFLAVLEGNSAAVANKGSGRVIASGPRDKVFLFYSDHGAAGVVGMPSGPFLYADELMAAIRRKFQKHGFKEMVM
jgi:legumain